MSNDPTDTILDYMKSLRNSMMFGRCAGKTTRLSKLHQNRLVSEETRTIARKELYRLANILTSALDATSDDEDREIAYLDFSNETQTFLREINQFFTDNPNMLTETKLPNQDITDFKAKSQEIIDLIQPESLLRFEAEFLELVKKFQSSKNPDKKSREKLTKLIRGSINRQSEYSEIRALMEKLAEKKTVLARLKNEYENINRTLNLGKINEKAVAMHRINEEIIHYQEEVFSRMKILDLTTENLPLFQYHSLLQENATLFHNTEDKFCNQATYGTISLIDNVERLQSENGGLISILGDPGWGKTIQLRQFTHEFLTKQIQERNTHQIPIYVKAKTLSKHIRNLASSHYGFAVDLPGGGVAEHKGKTTRHVGETNQILIRAMLETESDLSEEQIRNLFEIQRSVAKNMILIVDAYDEVPTQDARFEVVNFISDQVEHHAWPVIMTCRNSHEEELETVFKEMNNGVNPHHKYKIHFTNEELQFLMPTKLANAWGMNSDQISHTVALEFEAFKNVLTHPLFVGLFCMLKSEGAELSVLDIELDSEDRMSIHHISFLKQVIDFGLRINIKDRKSITDEDERTIRMAFLYIAAIHLTMGINNLDNILSIMEKLHEFRVSETQRKILAENLGVMFVNGEKEIEWTHKTLPEVAMGLLINENSNFGSFLINTYGGMFGKNGELWTECLFLTLIENDLLSIDTFCIESEGKLSKETMPTMIEIFSAENHSIIEKCLKLLGITSQIFEDAFVDLSGIRKDSVIFHDINEYPGVNADSWRIKPIPGNKFETELRNRIGNSYFCEMLSNDRTFALPIELFGTILENHDEQGLLFTLFDGKLASSSLIGLERLKWPEALSSDISLLLSNFSVTALANVYFKALLYSHDLFSKMGKKKFARNLRKHWIEWSHSVSQNPWIIDISISDFFDLILICMESNTDLDLLNGFMWGSRYEYDTNLNRYDLHDEKILNDLDRFMIQKINRGDFAPGKISSSWLLGKHRVTLDKLLESSIFMMVNTREVFNKNRWEKYILPLKEHWGIPIDFTMKGSKGSKFDRIQSLNVDKIPDGVLRYIVGKIE